MGRKLPKNPIKGKEYTIRVNSSKTNIGEDRLVTFKATGKKGFGKYRIVKNEPVPSGNRKKLREHRHRRRQCLKLKRGGICPVVCRIIEIYLMELNEQS